MRRVRFNSAQFLVSNPNALSFEMPFNKRRKRPKAPASATEQRGPGLVGLALLAASLLVTATSVSRACRALADLSLVSGRHDKVRHPPN